MIARRNKIHHLDKETDETLLNIFDKDPGDSTKTAWYNHCTMPSRNFAIIAESTKPHNIPRANGAPYSSLPVPSNVTATATGKNGHFALHAGEEAAGTKHPAASGVDESGIFAELGVGGGLDVTFRVEIDAKRDRDGDGGVWFY
jgi:hypothetical protein